MISAGMTESITSTIARSPVLVGLLAFQGAYAAHAAVFRNIGVSTREVRTPDEFRTCTHLVLPGGESSTMLRLLEFCRLAGPVRDHAGRGKPILATCAGAILLAKDVTNPPQRSLGLLDITVERNSYGRQVDSFETELEIPIVGDPTFHGVFIRAPKILRGGKEVEIMSTFKGDPVLVRQGNILCATFHPELSGDTRLHELFLNLR